MKRYSKWDWLTIGRASAGWTCEVQGAVESHTQYTWRHDAMAYGSHKWLVVALALAFLNWRRKVSEMRAIPGPYNNAKAAQAGKEVTK